MATAYVARFTRRILGVVGQESRAASPRMLDTSNGNGPPETDFMAELVRTRGLLSPIRWLTIIQEQFLQMPDNVVQNETKDQEYW